MKIGLLTLPICENYGGILQCVALYNYLTRQGHDVVILYKIVDDVKKIPIWKSAIKKLLLAIPFQDYKNLKYKYKKKTAQMPFIKKSIPNITDNLKTSEDLAEAVKKYQLEAVVVGSDQVWRLEYINDQHYKSFFLDFVDAGVKKIAYAASFGKDYWEGQGDEVEIGKLLERFDYISVREESGIDICKNVFDVIKDVHHVLDPTMLLSKDFYLSLMPSDSFKNTIPLLTYILDETHEKEMIISECIKELGVSLENVQHLNGFGNKKKCYTVSEWLEAFSKADFIITDSFHGMVFSIIFNKQFIVISNKNRGLDRFVSLLSILKLEDRLVSDINADLKCLKYDIEYSRINSLITELQGKSSAFLNYL